MNKKSLPERSADLDASIREARGLLETARRLLHGKLPLAANRNRDDLSSLQKALDALSDEVAAEIAKTVTHFDNPALHARLNRHRVDLDSIKTPDADLLRELGSLRAGINAISDLMRLFRERVDSLEIEYSIGAEALNEQDVRLLRFIEDIRALIVRYRNLERAIQAMMMLERGGEAVVPLNPVVPRLLR